MTNTSDTNWTSALVGLVLGGAAVGAYFLFFSQPAVTPSAPGATTADRAAEVQNPAGLAAADHELNATNLGEIDNELIQVQADAKL